MKRTDKPGSHSCKIHLRTLPLAAALVLAGCGLGTGDDSSVPGEARSATVPQSIECGTVSSDGRPMDGSELWVEIPNSESATACDFYQFSWNNFMWAIRDSDDGHPRFMELIRWDRALPESGRPDCSSMYVALDTTDDLRKDQAGDIFELVDVAGSTVEFDMRINNAFCEFIDQGDYFLTSAFTFAAQEFGDGDCADPPCGIWLPAGEVTGDPDTETAGAIEIKTAWRPYAGTTEPEVCRTVLHCERDAQGTWWGLLAMHWVQKTPSHGELIWASFEHVANSPDCASGGSNPIGKEPGDPANSDATINANNGLGELAARTGWNFFDYTSYLDHGGDGSTCSFPQGALDPETNSCVATEDALCNGDPIASIDESGAAAEFKQVNVCRTNQLPYWDGAGVGCNADPSPVALGTGATTDEDFVSCLNQTVVDAWPSGIQSKWKNYFLIGAEWVATTGTGPKAGAPSEGCFEYDDPPKPEHGLPTGYLGYECPEPPGDEGGSFLLAGMTSLASTAMETWLQQGMCNSYADGTIQYQKDCFACHTPQTVSGQPTILGGDGGLSHLFSRIQNPH